MSEVIRNKQHYQQGIRWLCANDLTLNEVVTAWGAPPMWLRRPGFVALLHIILEQQVSLASAQAIMDKLRRLVPRLTPGALLLLSDRQLRQAGFSQQKTRYARVLANAIVSRELILPALNDQSVEHIRAELTNLTGIGRWTADIYLLMAMRRRDVWPIGDLALRLAMRELYPGELGQQQREKKPGKIVSNAQTEDLMQSEFAEKWQPWRGVAARICWLHYLRTRNR